MTHIPRFQAQNLAQNGEGVKYISPIIIIGLLLAVACVEWNHPLDETAVLPPTPRRTPTSDEIEKAGSAKRPLNKGIPPMPLVTVDLDDLETLVMSTGVVKTVEGALAARKVDPFVRQHLDFTDAHDRLAAAMRSAKRADADTLVKWDEPLTDDEAKVVLMIGNAEHGVVALSQDEKAPRRGEQMSVVDSLAAKGCVVIGQPVRGVRWAGDKPPELQIDSSGFRVKLTQRGAQRFAELGNNSRP